MDGWPLGTLCVFDFKPRKLTNLQQRVLKVHARTVMRQLELTRALVREASSQQRNRGVSIDSQKEAESFAQAHRRFNSLTPREKEIMNLIVGRSGSLSSKDIARELDISHRTVHHHRASIMSKMHVDSVAELIAISLKAKIFE